MFEEIGIELNLYAQRLFRCCTSKYEHAQLNIQQAGTKLLQIIQSTLA